MKPDAPMRQPSIPPTILVIEFLFAALLLVGLLQLREISKQLATLDERVTKMSPPGAAQTGASRFPVTRPDGTKYWSY
jgi:hypothetical protein